MKYAAIVVGILAVAAPAFAEESEAAEHAEMGKSASALAPAMKTAKVSLGSGIETAAKEGTPISAKYEMEGGKLQLSVYTMKGDAFSEVVIDPDSGQVTRTEPITAGEDLADAKKQSAAMAKAKASLHDAVTSAEKSHAGYRAVSIKPEIENGKAEADVAMLKGTRSRVVEQKL